MGVRFTPEEIEVRVWATIVVGLMCIFSILVLGVLWAVTFEDQPAEISPIDGIFLEILKAVAYMTVGTLGGIAGRKARHSEDKNDPNSPPN